jgi:hypothetical protein
LGKRKNDPGDTGGGEVGGNGGPGVIETHIKFILTFFLS